MIWFSGFFFLRFQGACVFTIQFNKYGLWKGVGRPGRGVCIAAAPLGSEFRSFQHLGQILRGRHPFQVLTPSMNYCKCGLKKQYTPPSRNNPTFCLLIGCHMQLIICLGCVLDAQWVVSPARVLHRSAGSQAAEKQNTDFESNALGF